MTSTFSSATVTAIIHENHGFKHFQVGSLEAEKQTNARVFDELSAHDSRIGQELLQQKVLK